MRGPRNFPVSSWGNQQLCPEQSLGRRFQAATDTLKFKRQSSVGLIPPTGTMCVCVCALQSFARLLGVSWLLACPYVSRFPNGSQVFADRCFHLFVFLLSRSVVPFCPFLGEASPTTIDYRQKLGTLVLTSLLEDLVVFARRFSTFLRGPVSSSQLRRILSRNRSRRLRCTCLPPSTC